MKPITKEHYDKWEDAISVAFQHEQVILNRITYILEVWFAAFGAKLENWYFDNAGEGEVGNLCDNVNPDSIVNIYSECKPFPRKEMVILDKWGDEWGWESEIPLRWLFEDFEDEVNNGKKLFDEKELARKSKKKELSLAKKMKDEELIEKAKMKLSPEELAAIRRGL